MTFEEKVRLLASTKPGPEKQALLNKFTFGDAEFASRYYVDAMSFDQYMKVNWERFKPAMSKVAAIRANIKNKGWTDKKFQKYLGEIPEAIYEERAEFSRSLPKDVLDNNKREFFKRYPAFRVY